MRQPKALALFVATAALTVSLAGCSQLSEGLASVCSSAGSALDSVDAALIQAKDAAAAGDLDGVRTSLAGAQTAVDGVSADNANPVISGIVGALGDGLTGVSDGITAVDSTVADADQRIADIAAQLADAQTLVANNRDALSGACGTP